MTPVLACTQFEIQNFAEFGFNSACEYVRTACANETIRVDFIDLYYCTLDQSFVFFLPISALFLFVTFYIISSTAENYLEPILSKIAKSLGFSESLAGVTLVGLANGAPDVFAALAAGSKPNGGILIPLGALLGAAIFTTSIIFSACIVFSPNKMIAPDKKALKRDCMFYMFLLMYIVVLGFIGEITLLGSLGFFVQYVVFIGVVLYQESKFQKERSKAASQGSIENQREPEYTVTYHMEEELDNNDKINLTNFLLPKDHIKTEEPEISEHSLNVTLENSTIIPQAKASLQRTKSQAYYRVRHKIWKEFKEIENQSLFWKTVFIIIYPVKLIRSLTVPAPSADLWDKTKAIIQPFTVSLFLLWQLDLIKMLSNHVALIAYIFSCLTFSILIWKFASASEVPKGPSGILMRVVGFVTAVMWINFLANAIVDFISLVAIFTGLPLNYLSLTLLCYGNSTGDFFVDVSLSKKGYDKTAVSGVFAGQYFNLAIGFGASLTRQIIANGPKAFSLVPNGTASLINLILIGCILANLIIVVLWGQKTKFVFKKDFSVYSLCLYTCFLVVVTLLIF